MKKSKTLFVFIVLILVVLLSGCGGEGKDWEVDITKPLTFAKDQETEFEILITNQGKPVTGVNATAHIDMSTMNHGSLNLKLIEGENGHYVATGTPTMAGKYDVVLKLKKDGYTFEKFLEMDVEKAEGVATINGEAITSSDLEFYAFINTLHIAINREADQQAYQGAELDERMNYWDSQEKLNDDKNQLLTQIIRLRSMALLGVEKGHKATAEEVATEIATIRAKYEQSEAAVALINEFGEQKFWDTQENQYKMIVLTQKVQKDLVEMVRKENPGVSEQEITYLAQKQYEDLLVSQVNSLEIKIL